MRRPAFSLQILYFYLNAPYGVYCVTVGRMSISSFKQIRMARAALGWTTSELAELSGVSSRTLNRIETNDGFGKATKGNLKLIKEAFEASGIEFIGDEKEGPVVRLWKNKC